MNGRPPGRFDRRRPEQGLRINHRIRVPEIRVIFDDGWGLIRASNTQPALVLRFEASSPSRLALIRKTIEAELSQARQTLGA